MLIYKNKFSFLIKEKWECLISTPNSLIITIFKTDSNFYQIKRSHCKLYKSYSRSFNQIRI